MLHIKLTIQHIKYLMSQISFAHNINEIKHMTFKIARFVDGFGYGANIFECKMNEYRHMT